MTSTLAVFIIPRDMRAKGYEENAYVADFRDLVIKGADTLTIKADNEYFYLIGRAAGVTISSDFGVYDLNDTGINEMQHKHQGTITIINNTKGRVYLTFMQVIVKQK
ncbi:MAG: hypothetical protein ABI388_03390 [Bacteroidia bacterium]